MSEELATQVLEDQNEGVNGETDNASAGSEPFLAVNDRTSYKTREDALKGFTEAQSRIAALSGYEKVLKDHGAKNVSPDLLKQIVTEYLTLKNAKGNGEATKSKPEATTSGDGDEDLTAEQKAALKWLEKYGEKAGYVSKKQLDALQAKLDAFEGNTTKAEEARRDASISECQEAVTGWLSEAKVALNEEERTDLEEHIAAWVNARSDRVSRFERGGQSAVALIREGYGKLLPIVKEGAVAFANAGKPVIANGKAKTGLMSKTAKPLPKGDENAKGNQPTVDKAKRVNVDDASLFDKAVALANRMKAERAGAE